MQRIASCSCGSLRVVTTGEPTIVTMCHCSECQRRTGSVFGVGAYFQKDRLRSEGVSTVYSRPGQEGRQLIFHFCPTCGTTVYWALDMRPDHFGVAVGCFVDPKFTAPQRSVYEETRHHWVATGHDVAYRARGT